jgi:hypothetical protein
MHKVSHKPKFANMLDDIFQKHHQRDDSELFDQYPMAMYSQADAEEDQMALDAELRKMGK